VFYSTEVAGYDLATGNLYYFAGAFYLFLINSACAFTATKSLIMRAAPKANG
jgi:hypothetical protein